MTRTKSRRHGQDQEVEIVCLSRRESQVLRLHVEGKRAREIGETLGISPRTARTYLTWLVRGLKLNSSTDLTRWAMQRPEALRNQPVAIEMHREDCDCGAPYCSAMRPVQAAESQDDASAIRPATDS